LTSLPERQQFVEWLGEAVKAGAGKGVACEEMGVSLRTIERWTEEDVMHADARTTTVRPTPANALSQDEREAILAVCNSQEEHAHLPPSQIVPRLAD
jgi:putative transposase